MKPDPLTARPRGFGRALTLGHFIVAASALCLMGMFLLTYQFLTSRDALTHDVETLAVIISKNSAASLMFNDSQTAQEILHSFQGAPYLESAVIFNLDRKPFARYSKDADKPVLRPETMTAIKTTQLGLATVNVMRPILFKDQLHGYVALTATMTQLYEKLFVYAFFYLAASIVAIGLSLPIVSRLRRQIIKAEERLDFYAFTDPVTGLPNRRAFQAKLLEAGKHAESTGSLLGVLLLDLDDFKSVNDTLGHSVGDQLLQSLAQRLRDSVKSAGVVYRVGGDEFGVILYPLKDTGIVRYAAKRILAAIAAPCDLAGRQVFSTVSIGASIFPTDTTDLTLLVSNADMAMYAAKKSGKNAFLAFDSQMFLMSKNRLELERDIRRGVENSEFVVYYQTQFSAKSNALVGVEALLRWMPPDGSVIGPSEFIPVAESTGLIVDLGRWVLFQACTHARSWADQGLGHIRVSVNVSARQLRDPGLLKDVIRTLAETGLPPSLLELELTESLLMDDVEQAIVFMRAAQEHGIQISIDDFGTGFSSLAYLQKFPLNRLKIDRSFITRLPGSGDTIVTAIIGLAHSFGLEVVAEGVETESQLEWLQIAGCDIIQGYLLGRPVSEEQVRQVLAKRSGLKISRFFRQEV